MRIILPLAMLFLMAVFEASAQLKPLSLSQRVNSSELVLEGKVIGKTAAWDKDRRHIYTVNTISVYKVFKGQLQGSTIELITIGGVVGNEREDVSYGLKLNQGDTGVFTCIPATSLPVQGSSAQRFRPYSEVQGFIGYDMQNGGARDVFNTYESIQRDIYSPIQKLTKRNYQVLHKADFPIK